MPLVRMYPACSVARSVEFQGDLCEAGDAVSEALGVGDDVGVRQETLGEWLFKIGVNKVDVYVKCFEAHSDHAEANMHCPFIHGHVMLFAEFVTVASRQRMFVDYELLLSPAQADELLRTYSAYRMEQVRVWRNDATVTEAGMSEEQVEELVPREELRRLYQLWRKFTPDRHRVQGLMATLHVG